MPINESGGGVSMDTQVDYKEKCADLSMKVAVLEERAARSEERMTAVKESLKEVKTSRDELSIELIEWKEKYESKVAELEVSQENANDLARALETRTDELNEMTTLVNELKSEESNYRLEIRNLKSASMTVSSQLEQMQQKTQRRDKSVEELEALMRFERERASRRFAEMKEENEALEKKLTPLTSDYRILQDTAKRRQELIDQLSQDLVELKVKYEGMEDQVRDMTRSNSYKFSNSSIMKTMVKERDEAIVDLTGQLEANVAELNNLAAENEEIIVKNDELKKEISAQEKVVQESLAAQKRCEEAVRVLEVALENEKIRSEDLQAEVERRPTPEEHEKVKSKLLDAETQVSNLATQVSNLETAVTGLNESVAAKSAEIENLRKENAAVKENCERIENTLEEVQEKNFALESSLTVARKDLFDSEESLKQAKVDGDRKAKELTKEVEYVKETMNAELKRTKDRLEGEVQEFEKQLGLSKKRANELSADVELHVGKYRSTQQNLDMKEEELAETNRKLRELNSAHERAESELNATIEEYKTLLDEEKQLVESLQDEIQTLNEQLDDFEKKLDDHKIAHADREQALAEKHQEAEKLRQEIASHAQSIEEHRKQNEDLAKVVEEKEKNLSTHVEQKKGEIEGKFSKTVKELEAERIRLTSELEKWKGLAQRSAGNSIQIGGSDGTEFPNGTLKAMVAEKDQEHSFLRNRLAKANSFENSESDEMDRLRSQLKLLEPLINQRDAEIEGLRQALEMRSESGRMSHSDDHSLRSQLYNKQQDMETQEIEFRERYESMKRTLRGDNDRLQGHILDLEGSLKVRDLEVQNLQFNLSSKHNEIEELKDEVLVYRKRCESLYARRRDVEERMERLENEIRTELQKASIEFEQQQRDEIVSLKARISSLSDELKSATQRASHAEEKADEYCGRSIQLGEELAHVKAKLSEGEPNPRDEVKDIVAEKIKNESLSQKIESLTLIVAEKESQIEDYEKQLATLREETGKKAGGDLYLLENIVKEKEKEIEALMEELEAKKISIDNAEKAWMESKDNMTEEIFMLKKSIDTIVSGNEQELGNKQYRIAELSSQVESLTDEVEKLRANPKKKKSGDHSQAEKLESIQKTNASLTARIATLEQELADRAGQAAQYAESSQSLQALQEKYTSLENEKAQAEAELKETLQQKNAIAERVEQMWNEAESQAAIIRGMEQEIQEAADLREKFKQLENEVSEYKDKKSAGLGISEVQDLKDEVQELKDKIDELHGRETKALQRCDDLAKRLHGVTDDSSLSQELQNAKKTIDDLEKRLADVTAASEELLNEHEDEVARLTHERDNALLSSQSAAGSNLHNMVSQLEEKDSQIQDLRRANQDQEESLRELNKLFAEFQHGEGPNNIQSNGELQQVKQEKDELEKKLAAMLDLNNVLMNQRPNVGSADEKKLQKELEEEKRRTKTAHEELAAARDEISILKRGST